MDKLSKDARSENMRRIRSRDTVPELAVRSLIHSLGFRFRLHRKDLPGKPDIALPRHHKLIYIHGCFWHQHSRCVDGRMPKTRQDYWSPKLTRNQVRDKLNVRKARLLGWKSLVVWECELNDSQKLLRRLNAFLCT